MGGATAPAGGRSYTPIPSISAPRSRGLDISTRPGLYTGRMAPSTPDATAPTGPWTSRTLLSWMGDAFRARDLDAPRVLAELLLAHVLECDRMRLYMEADRPASPEERDRLRALVSRALRHEPVQYLVGEAWFFSMPFHVDPRVLIPRPSTATIVEHVLQDARESATPPARIADICTGSGCIATALLKHLPDAHCVAVDISPDALEVAAMNAETHGVRDRLDLRCGDLLEPIEEPVDVLVSNPPYIPDHEWDAVEPNVRDHEPHLALRASPDGLRFVRPLIDGLGTVLKPGGQALIEIAACTADEVVAYAETRPELGGARILKDCDDLPRVLVVHRVMNG